MTARQAFYGWVVLAAAFAIITLSIGTLITLGVFMKPMEGEKGWSRSSIGAIGLLDWIVVGLGGVLGRLSCPTASARGPSCWWAASCSVSAWRSPAGSAGNPGSFVC